MRVEYQEHDLNGVMRYYAEGFMPKSERGKRKEQIVKYEFTIDTFTRKVIFKLYVVQVA